MAIHGLDGGADTRTDLDKGIQNPGEMGDTCSWTLSSDQVTANKNKNRSSLGIKQKAGDYENGMKEIIAMKKKSLELEERKVKVIERIASTLEGHKGHSCTEFAVSPIIKFN